MDLSFFAQMAWKSALIASAALLLAYSLRSRSAADRALVLRIGVTMLLLLPLIALWMPALEIVAFAAPDAVQLPYDLSELQLAALASAAPAPEPTIWDDPTPLVVLAYLGGLVMVGSRLLAGLWLLRRWTRAARDVTCPEWLDAFDRVRWLVPNAESVRLMESDEVRSPLSWGWRHPVILIDPDTLGQPDGAEAILAHEAAHIARRDWPALMLSRLAATLFWFNPLVWLLEREVVQQAEEAADCEAAGRVEPAVYAETLLNWAQSNSMVPANSIAPSAQALGRRVKAILDRGIRERPSGSAWTGIAMLLCIAIATPVAAVQLVAATPPAPPQPPEAPAAPDVPDAPEAPVAPDAPVAPHAPRAPDDIVIVVPNVGRIVTPAVDHAMRDVMPRIPAIVARATAAVDSREIERALREADIEINQIPVVSRDQIRTAMRESQRVRVRVPHAQIEAAMRQARRAEVVAARASAHAYTNAADGMMQGAAGMESGARRMEAEADHLQDRDYRERQIARARARGETVTHEQLLEAAEGLREGAEGMREGAEEMREAARNMREHHDSDDD